MREWRIHRGLSLHAAADKIGISHAQLGRIERGKQEYRQRILEAAAVLYDCTIVDLISRRPP